MRVLKIQEAQLLLKKILNNPRNYHLSIVNGEVLGNDEEISFRFYKAAEKGIFEVTIDSYTFSNNTGEWTNAIIMLESTIRKMEREHEEEKVTEALNKLKRYLSTE